MALSLHPGGRWQAVLREPDQASLDRLWVTPGVFDYEETPLSLEEVYCGLFAGKGGAASSSP